jgi:hypothetical protein
MIAKNLFKSSKIIGKNKLIEVFKTNIQNKIQSDEIKNEILKFYPNIKIDFDLEDIDNVLRIEGLFFDNHKIIDIFFDNKYYCEIMV